jgi:hypothetical protein
VPNLRGKLSAQPKSLHYKEPRVILLPCLISTPQHLHTKTTFHIVLGMRFIASMNTQYATLKLVRYGPLFDKRLVPVVWLKCKSTITLSRSVRLAYNPRLVGFIRASIAT